MDKEHEKKQRKNLLQNLLIVLLSVSALLMFLQSQSVFDHQNRLFSRWFSSGGTTAAPTLASSELTALTAPVRIAVSGVYGRYGSLSTTTSDEEFSQLGSLLREALGSAEDTAAACTEADFQHALSQPSVYYDFCSSLPLSVLAGYVGAEISVSAFAQRIVLAEEDGKVLLYCSDGDAYTRASTKVSSAQLQEVCNSYPLGNASFVFDLGQGISLSPYSLLLTGDQESYPVLSAGSAVDSTDTLLTALGFNPRTNSRYTESNGTEVVMEGDRTLRIRTDSTLEYDCGNAPELLKVCSNPAPSLKEAVLGCSSFLGALSTPGDAGLYLQQVREENGVRTLSFAYQSGGLLILQRGGAPAAEITLQGSSVLSFTFTMRQYRQSTSPSLILPLTQALAIARRCTGKQLQICYLDSGGTELSAGWIAG